MSIDNTSSTSNSILSSLNAGSSSSSSTSETGTSALGKDSFLQLCQEVGPGSVNRPDSKWGAIEGRP